MKASAGEVYTVYNQYLKRYTACQKNLGRWSSLWIGWATPL